jgi:hypothetical protein
MARLILVVLVLCLTLKLGELFIWRFKASVQQIPLLATCATLWKMDAAIDLFVKAMHASSAKHL